MVEGGLYIIKDQFFIDMDEPGLKHNKGENRPHYYCFKDDKNDLYWMIPLSSKVDKYRKIVDKRISEGKRCDIVYITKLDNGKWNALLIADMFPIVEKYIKREYTIAGNHLRISREKDIREINQRAKKVLGMLKRGIQFTPTQPDVFKMQKRLIEEPKETTQ